MSGNLCPYSNRVGRELKCTLGESQVCKYVRYCTIDSKWWNSNNFTSCERRKQEMSKNKNRNYENFERKNENIVIAKEQEIVATEDIKEDVSIEVEAIKEPKKEKAVKVSTPQVPKRSRRRTLY